MATRCISVDLAAHGIAERIARETTRLEVGLLVYNAAQPSPGWFAETGAHELSRALGLNCRAPLLFAREFGRAGSRADAAA